MPGLRFDHGVTCYPAPPTDHTASPREEHEVTAPLSPHATYGEEETAVQTDRLIR